MHTPETLLTMTRAFEVHSERARRRFDESSCVWVEWRGSDPDRSESWCISDGAATLSRNGIWEIKPRLSAQEEDYLARTRWPFAVKAITVAKAFFAANPTGCPPEAAPRGD